MENLLSGLCAVSLHPEEAKETHWALGAEVPGMGLWVLAESGVN